jgi:acyl carrier protein
MEMETLHRKLTEVFQNVFDDDSIEIFDSMTAAEIEDWDSMEHINLIVATEQVFGIKFALSEIGDLPDVGAFKQLIFRKVNV